MADSRGLPHHQLTVHEFWWTKTGHAVTAYLAHSQLPSPEWLQDDDTTVNRHEQAPPIPKPWWIDPLSNEAPHTERGAFSTFHPTDAEFQFGREVEVLESASLGKDQNNQLFHHLPLLSTSSNSLL
jgi:hypothetical protein